LNFKVDFITPVRISQSIFGKDHLAVKILKNEIIKTIVGTPMKKFNEVKKVPISP
jgi:hypothetical protein